MCDAEQFKAWSQNLGHEGVPTTFLSYGSVAINRPGQIMQDLAKPSAQAPGEPGAAAKALPEAMKMAGLLPANA